jgi:hypothetical protein
MVGNEGGVVLLELLHAGIVLHRRHHGRNMPKQAPHDAAVPQGVARDLVRIELGPLDRPAEQTLLQRNLLYTGVTRRQPPGRVGRAEEGRGHRGTKRLWSTEVVKAGGMAAPWSTRLPIARARARPARRDCAII